jgi:hypothetical protein
MARAIQIQGAYILFNGPQWPPKWREQMNTSRTTRFTGLMIALLITVGIQGSMLWTFDAVAYAGQLASAAQPPYAVTLESVQVVAPRHS